MQRWWVSISTVPTRIITPPLYGTCVRKCVTKVLYLMALCMTYLKNKLKRHNNSFNPDAFSARYKCAC